MSTELNSDGKYKAILSRDARYDSLFYFAVKTTGIYCRPSCPATRPLQRNVIFYDTIKEARQQGFRACKRCRPDMLNDSMAREFLDVIQAGGLNEGSVGGLAKEFGVTERHLRRIVQEKMGTSPIRLKQAKRLDTAMSLLMHTQLPIIDVAFSADFRSLRQFNNVFKQSFKLTPHEIRKSSVRSYIQPTPLGLHLHLNYKTPMAWSPLVKALKAHAIPHVDYYDEQNNTLTRYLKDEKDVVKIVIDLNDYTDHVRVYLEVANISHIDGVVLRIRRLMDLDHSPARVNEVLGRDPILAPMIVARPGLRIAGSFSPFEMMVCTIIGQQISVAAARTVVGRLVKAYGEPYHNAYIFPAATVLARADPTEIYERTKLNYKKIMTLQAFAVLVDAGLELDDRTARVKIFSTLLNIKGIGPWSVAYFALRGLGDPDAFPADDLLIKRKLGTKNASEAIRASEQWRPLRGYAAMHIWTEGAYL